MRDTFEDSLMTNRSYNSCIAAGYKLYISNFTKFFKALWCWGILYAIAVSALGTISSIYLPRILLMPTFYNDIPLHQNPDFIILCLVIPTLIVIGGLFEITFYSCGVSLLHQHKENNKIEKPKNFFYFNKQAAWQTLKACFFYMIIALVITIPFITIHYFFLKNMLISPKDHILSVSIIGVAIIIIVLAAIPFNFTCIKYLLEPKNTFWRMIPRDYNTALHNYSYVFIVSIITAIVVFIVNGFVSLPATIISQANYIANRGLIQGDPLGMPGYIMTLTAITFFICGFLQAFVRLTCLFPAYYMYGALEIQEKERQHNKEQHTKDL